MNDRLDSFLAAYPSHSEYEEVWGDVSLHVRLCLAGELPPVQVRSSVLGIVFRSGSEVLFIHPDRPSGDIAHLIIGGRPEPCEQPEQTLVREIAEESGWCVRPCGIIGVRHFRHQGPLTPSMADRPYPDFLQPIYVAIAESYDPSLLLPDEAPCNFVDATWAEQVTQPKHHPLLRAANAFLSDGDDWS